MTDQIEQILKSVKARSSPELHQELETLSQEIDDLQAENEQLREAKESLQTELKETTKGTLELASEMEERYQRLFKSAHEGIYTATESLDEYDLANPAFADLLGYESGEALCEAVDSIEDDVFVDSDKYKRYADTLDAVGEINQFEYQVRTAEGETRWVSDSVKVLRDDQGGFEGYRGAVIDITEKKNQEEALKRQTNLSIVLNRVLRHNLRNDISVVRGYTQMMAEKLDDTNYGEKALKTIDSLIELSEKARVLDQLISSDANPEPADIPALVEEIATQMRQENSAATISVETPDEGVTAEVLPSFKRAIEEVVENAIKHSGDNPRVDITIEANPDDIQIRIADNGPGIEEQDASVFRSGSETPLLHGSGLGLWLTNWIVTSQGGLIDATATEEGTTLSVLVPKTPSEGAQKQLNDLVRARDQYKSAFEEAGDGMTITDDEGHILDLNNEAARIFGVDQQEMIGRPIREFLPEDFDFEAEWGEIKAAEMKRDEVEIVTGDGGICPIEYTAKSHIVPGQHLIVSRDITERKKRETSLRKKSARLEVLFENSPDMIDVLDPEGTILDVNRRLCEDLNYNKDELLGTPIWELDQQVEAEDVKTLLSDFDHGERRQFEGRYERRDGSTVPVEVHLLHLELDGKDRFIAESRDITEQKERERNLRNLRERFELAVEAAELGVWDWDMTTGEVELNEQYVEMLGYTKEEFGHHVDDWKTRIHPDDREQMEARLDVHTAGETEYFETEYRLQTAEGDWMWLQSLGKIVDRDDEGDPLRFVGIQFDISERKARERKLQETKQRLEGIIKLSPEPIWVLDTSGTVILWNEAAEDAFGYPAEETIGAQLQSLALFTDEQSSRFQERFERVVTGETITGLEVERERKDGTPVHLSISAAPLRDASDSVTGIIAAGQDITEVKEREQKIRDLNQQLHTEKQRYESLFNSIQDAILVANTDREIINCNPAFEDLFGYELEEIEGKHTKYVYESEEEYEAMGEAIEGHIGDPEFTYTVTYETKSGQTFPGETNIFYLRNPAGEIAGFIGVIRDLSEVKELTKRLNIVLAGTDSAVWGWDLENNTVHWSDTMEQLFGFYPETFEESIEAFAEYVHPEDWEKVVRDFQAAIESDGRVETEFRIRPEDGNQVWVEARGQVHESANGNRRMTGIITDITDRKKWEEELVQYEAAFKKAGDGMTITDDEARILDVNEEATQIYGVEKQKLVGRSMKDFLPDDFDFEAEWGEIQAAKMKRDEMKIVSADGGVNPVEYTAKTDIVPGQHLIISRKITSMEMTKQQKREEKLQRQNERLNEFASVVSHDLRNPLNVAKGRIAIAQEEYDSDQLDTAARSIERSFDLIEDTLTLAQDGQQVSEMQPVDVGSLIETCWKDFDTANATVAVDLDQTIQADRSRLRQLLENLIRNAVEHGGDDVVVRVGALPDGFYVEDDGPGIPEDERESVFEPGHSNTPDGTGFGLAIVRRIAEAHGWEVHVTEGADGGARFEFRDIEVVAE
ncbi:PAS domain S-box protein [Halodesulfurarchaeum sp. HSR-GB]|uniref:PAS domain S-box protein n=1 Tax=Halodesulfurarchaeum sp. HSR-GB TaxID=3074077 RepID=UPI002862D902|nr:PAS domain S-box protein [Halodesulfurarchaeum sp. HSR-GB]MDR5657711.1 PAS domain S-box protein [Halodesulfurarchaeum sp. HSR-GB]